MKKYHFEQFTATRLYSGLVAYSPDGKWILHSNNTTGQFNLWKIPSGGGIPCQLTNFTDNTLRGAAWSPDGLRILFIADQNGDEQHQVYAIGSEGGWPEAITSAMKAQHAFGGDPWSPDGRMIAYGGNDREPTNQDVILRDMESGETARPVPPLGYGYPGYWSPDGRYLTVGQLVSNTDQNMYLYDTQSGETVHITPHEGEVKFFPGPWSPDGSGFYFLTDVGREYTGLALYSVTERRWDWVDAPDQDIENVDISRSGEVMVWVLNNGGASQLRGINLESGNELQLPDLPLGVVSGMNLSPDGTRLALVFTHPGEAPNLYEFDLQTGQMQPLGQSMLGGIDPADMVQPDLITYTSADGRTIPAWLYKPKTGSGPYPVVLSIHGGPESQERPTYAYNGLYQYLLNRGFGVLAPNIRGSTGYGKTYQKLIHRDWGGAELKDIEYAAKYLRSLDWVDGNRLAVFGGSFGGFATLSAVTRLPDYWAAAVDLVGPSNLLTFTRSVPPTWRALMRSWVGDPEDDHDLLVERSPITYVDHIKAPLLVIQGANDPRVVKAESDQMVERIRTNGGEVQYYVDEQEGHGATRTENRNHWFRLTCQFLEEHLLDEPAG